MHLINEVIWISNISTFLLHLSQWYASAPSNSSPFTYCSRESVKFE